MIIRVGQTAVQGPDGETVAFRVVQALDPIFELPVAQIAIPIGEQSLMIGDAIAGREGEPESKIIVPDFPPPSDLKP